MVQTHHFAQTETIQHTAVIVMDVMKDGTFTGGEAGWRLLASSKEEQEEQKLDEHTQLGTSISATQ